MNTYFVSDIEFEATELLETISVHDQTYLAVGYNSKGHKYEGTAHVSCGEIVKVTDIEVSNESDFNTKKMNDDVLGHLREAGAILNDETKEA